MNTANETNPMNPAAHAPDAMRPTRNGKIARLPQAIREELNRRLTDGRPGPEILAWLNADPETRRVLERDFGGKAISLQNLSKWRQGGLGEWQLYHTARAEVQAMAAAVETRFPCPGDLRAAYSRVYAVEVVKALQQSREHGAHAMEKWECLRGGLRLVHAMRRSEHDAARLALAEEKQRWRANPAESDQIKPYQSEQIESPVTDPAAGNAIGTGKPLTRPSATLSPSDGERDGVGKIVVNPEKSCQIKPNQTEKQLLEGALDALMNSGADVSMNDLFAVIELIHLQESRQMERQIQVNPGESSHIKPYQTEKNEAPH